MSIVQAALAQVLNQLKEYQSKSGEKQFQIIQTAYSLLGRPFLEALIDIEKSPEELIIKETPHFISVAFRDSKEILFLNKDTCIGFECICEISWGRKTNQSNELICKHEAIFLLWKFCFPQYAHYSARMSRDQDPNELAITQLLYRVNQNIH